MESSVTAIEPNAVTLITANVSLRRFAQRPGEVLVLGQVLDTRVRVNDPERARRLGADGCERRPHGPDDQVLLARPGQVLALAGDLDGQPGGQDPRLHLVVQRQGQPGPASPSRKRASSTPARCVLPAWRWRRR